MKGYKKIIDSLLDHAGIKTGGKNPWDITVHDNRFYKKVITQGSIGLGEAYMDGWWDCGQLDNFFFRIIKNKVDEKVKINVRTISGKVITRLVNRQSKKRLTKDIKKHYDLGNELFLSFLDPNLQYSCAYYKNTSDLNKAQEQKLELICKKLNLSSNDKVLDIGCGWGGFAKYAASKYGCHVTGINISDEQVKYARENCKGLPVEITKLDYREIKGKYDKIVSVEMLEHVGSRNHHKFMKAAHNCLKEEGIFLLQTGANNISRVQGDPWMDKYIFPGAVWPSIKQISTSMEGLFTIQDLENITSSYDKTLMAWFNNLNDNWSNIKSRYDERTKRMFNYYLLSCAGLYRTHNMQALQLVLTKPETAI
jgi:cyclopropane-fatty-acyl-phospholipid synthase